jgi:predicted porin
MPYHVNPENPMVLVVGTKAHAILMHPRSGMRGDDLTRQRYIHIGNIMKMKFLSLAGLVVFSSVAQAQSSVTLYGTLDTAVAYFSNQKGANGSGGTVQMVSGTLTGDNWGLKGNEDLGGGMAAIFNLQAGYNLNTGAAGQGGRMFGRTAMVGLADKSYGTVTLGRQYDPLVDLIQPLTEDDTYGSAFATPGDIDNYDNSSRVNDSVKYTSPVYAGLQVSAMYAFGGESGETSAGQTYAIAAAYNHGPLNLAAGYLRANNGTSPTYDGFTSTGLDSTAINGAFISATTLQIIRAAGTYAIGPVTLGAAYSNVDYGNYAAAPGTNNGTRFNTAQAFVNYQLNAALELGVGYDYTKGSGNNVDAGYNQVSLGADYALSKRTDLYALAAYQRVSGDTIDAGTGQVVAATASIADFGNDSATNSQTMVMVGIRHHF